MTQSPWQVDGITPASDLAPSWACQWIAFQSDRDGNWEIYRLDPDTGETVRLTDHPAADVAPSWSPDGGWVVFQSDRDGQWDLYLMDRNGQNLRRLTDHQATDAEASWSDDGEWLYFHSDREGSFDIWKLAVETGELVRLTDGVGDETDPEGTPYCDWIYYEVDDRAQVYRMKTDGSQQENVILNEPARDPWLDFLGQWPTTDLGYELPDMVIRVALPIIIVR